MTDTANASVTIDKAEMRRRAYQFVKDWAGERSEQAEKQTFWNEFFAVFGVKRRQVAAYEAIANRASTGHAGWIDLLLPGQMGVEHKSEGKSLEDAMQQLIDYLPALAPAEHPWLLVVSDFANFHWRNLDNGTQGEFELAQLPDSLDLFSWIAGYRASHRVFADEVAANLKATQLLADLHDALLDGGYPPDDLREWITRILFCLFADDAGVWDRGAFHSYVALHTAPDGHDLGDVISRIFRVLDTPTEQRPGSLDEDLAQFNYINGDLFANGLWPVTGDVEARRALLAACTFDWSYISPAIFGSLFQNVMTAKERRHLGAHYTTEENILRTIRPLFLDELEAELAAATSEPKLQAFRDKLGSLTFFDPACGCGNFLVVAYREIRRLETECLRLLAAKQAAKRKLGPSSEQRALNLDLLCQVKVDQFYGIEIEEFPARIARTALYLMDHIANREVSLEFGPHYLRFPIPAAPHIRIDNALTIDWNEVLPAERCTYLFGNPPFGGHQNRTKQQSDWLRLVWGTGYAKWLDYVTAWYRRALEYDTWRSVRCAFVSTNSICQGEQVARLWQPLLDAGYRIDWAHQTFAWTSEARGKAHVHVVIVGFSHGGGTDPVLYVYETVKSQPVRQRVSNISPYLVEGPNVAVAGRAYLPPLSRSMPAVRYGSLPSDGGGLIVGPDEFPEKDSVAVKYLRPYFGSKELVHGLKRWVIWAPGGLDTGDLARSAFLRKRFEEVRNARLESRNPDTIALAEQPYRWFHNAQPEGPYIGIPAQVSETRRWYTVAHLGPDTIASNTLYTADDPDGFLFGVLSSSMFMAWIRSIGGAIKSDLRYSKSIVHNTFPLPAEITDLRRAAVIQAGQGLLDARAAHPGATLADLYEPLATPPDVVAAHARVDKAVDAIFDPRKRRWSQDDRVELLLDLYVAAIGDGQLVPQPKSPTPARRRRTRPAVEPQVGE